MQKSKLSQRNLKTKVVLVGGCFDILHYGHIYFLKKAKRLGDFLVVALESDENTKRLKGPKRPIHTQKRRAEMLKSLRFVDRVISLPPNPDYELLTKAVKPDIIACDQEDNLLRNKKVYENLGAKIVVIPKIKTPSTTQIAKLLKLD
ncbi:MAG: adenylyltransferase/cytidyltransferase family protein [Patescibacteria group bacterium]